MQAAIKNPIEPSQNLSKTPPVFPFWIVSGDVLLGRLHSSLQGLTGDEASRRLAASAGSHLDGRQKTAHFVLLLCFAAGLSMFLGEHTEALIISFIVFVGGLLSFWQERGQRML